MRSIRVTLTVALLLICALPIMAVPTDVSAAGGTDNAVLYEVMPTKTGNEGFTIYNGNGFSIDLKDYTVEDGEGKVTFNSLIVAPMKTVTIWIGSLPEYMEGGWTVYAPKSHTKFIMANDKDDIYLKKNGILIDTMVYGNTTAKEGGWVGDPVKGISGNKIAQRVSPVDTDSAKDWRSVTPGATMQGDIIPGDATLDMLIDNSMIGDVTPFTLPESNGSPVFNALEEATEEILISVYILDHPNIIGLLYNMMTANSSLVVKILLEGSPTGDEKRLELARAKALAVLENVRPGDDIFFIDNDNDYNYKRYAYLHNKYAVIDSKTVILTSENWRTSSFTENRGWGAVIESTEYAEFMRTMFLEDIDPSHMDIFSFEERYPDIVPDPAPIYASPADTTDPITNVSFLPAVTPYRGYELLNFLLDNAEERIFSQQMSITNSWITDDSPLKRMINATADGLDVRLIIDDMIKKDAADFLSALNGAVRAKAADEGTFKDLVHNKGVIIDNFVWVSSMNWTDNSAMNNRETGLIIFSAEVTQVYLNAFYKDWGSEVFEGTVEPKVKLPKEATAGGLIVLDASASHAPSDASYGWDLDGDNKMDRTGKKIAVELPVGDHEITLYVTDDTDTYDRTFTLSVGEGEELPIQDWMYIAGAIVALIILILIKVLSGNKSRPPAKKSSGKNNSSKNKGKKK
jgi:Phosphatidylserine/phosphatidylglycerophosphate/cardiolipin synthases and related enzymes